MKYYCANDLRAVPAAAAVLASGGVVALPTETVYGLVASWEQPEAWEKIYRLKHRPTDKRLQMLARSLDSAFAAGVAADTRLKLLARRFWPGALTIVVASHDGGSIGLRVPAHPLVQQLLHQLGRPLAATSANLSGQPTAVTAQQAIAHLDGQPDLVIDGGVVTATAGQASTVVSLLEKEPRLLRLGPIEWSEITAALEK